MGKFFVTIKNYNSNYKVSKEDIERVYSIRKNRIPTIPRYHNTGKEDYEEGTSCGEEEIEFQPINFFPLSQTAQQWK